MAGHAERPVSYKPRAKEWRGFCIGKLFRYRKAERSIGNAMGGKAPVPGEPSEEGVIAEIFLSRVAVAAFSTCAPKPRYADTVSSGEV